MKIQRMTMVTLGVENLADSTAFYTAVLGTKPNTQFDGVTFVELPGTWLGLYPIEKLAEDISANLSAKRGGFTGFSLAYNAASKNDVLAVFERVKAAGAKIIKPPEDVFWGGFSGYFEDLDGYYWEVVWGPMFEFNADGSLTFKE